MNKRIEALKEFKDVIKSYYKWKGIGVVGIWLGSGIASLGKTIELTLAIIVLDVFASLLYCLIGMPQVSYKIKKRDDEKDV